jgi:hypothetical protein
MTPEVNERIMKQSYTFRINHEQSIPAALPRQFVAELTEKVNSSKPVDSDITYSKFMAGIAEVIQKYSSQLTADTPTYDKRLPRIGRHEQTISVPAWGGVFFRDASEPRDYVEKYLIVKQASDQFGVLGFEYHNRKIEKLKVEEGYAMFIKSDEQDNVSLTFAGPGDTCELNPPTAHGIVPLTNTAVLETSNYELDADDLIYIFQPVKLSSTV